MGLLFLVMGLHTINSIKMVDNVETTTPTVEEVATNGESETATDEVKEVTAAASENGANGTHEAGKNGEAKEDKEDEATKRKADAPSEDETSEKIAKLKETAAEVVTEAEKKLPEEPLTEAEATA